jgi:phage tail-like protein
MIDKSRDLEYPALGYVFSVAAVDATRSPRSAKSRGLRSVRLNSNGADADFQSISGIKATRNTEVYRPLGMSNYSYHLPTTTSYEDLVLERGVVKTHSDFTLWCNSFINLNLPGLSSESSSTAITQKLILVFLWDRDKNKPLMTWTFYDAIPKSIEYSGVSAKESSYAIEKITIAYSHFETEANPVTAKI